jgi:hypothetical protein
MEPQNRIDFQAWNEKLDSGARSDPLLELASRIREVVPEYEGPTKDFQEHLRTRLLNQFSQVPGRRAVSRRWFFVWGLAVFVIMVVAFVGLWRSPWSLPDASAAEILELAGQHLSERLAVGDIVYDRWIMDWHKGGFQEKGVVAELWRSADGSHMRFQMVNDRGNVLYFDQREDKTIWRSSYVNVEEGREVGFVYQAPYMPAAEYLGDQQLSARLLFRDFGNFWTLIDQMAGSERSDCAQLFCVLSALGRGWICSGKRCTLNLGPSLEGEDSVVEAQVDTMDWLPNGREVYQVHLHVTSLPERWYHILKFDTETYDLLEIERYKRGTLQYRLSLDDRETLSFSDLPADFFKSIPDGVEVRLWPSDSPLGHYEDDRVWVISADPPPDSNISGMVNAEVELGYQLTSVEQAAIQVGRLYWAGHDTGVALGVASVPVTAGEGSIRVSFSFDSDQLGEGEWSIHPGFVDVLGINPNIGWGGSGDPDGILYLKWCVGCTPASPAP